MKLARRRLFALLSGLGLTGCGGPGRASTPKGPAADTASPEPVRYTYGEHPSQFVELTLPAGSGVVPVVVVVHGGFWRTAYGLELGRPLAADLVRRGWAAVNVEYRRVGSGAIAGGGGWPQTGEDVAMAVDALKTQGQRLAGDRLDLSRVVAIGHSAGGQLAGWLASRPGLPAGSPGADPAVSLSGFVSQAGVLDLVGAANEGVGGRAVTDLMGGEPDQLAAAYRSASPLARLPLGVPRCACTGAETCWCRRASPNGSWLQRSRRAISVSCTASTATTSSPSRSAPRPGPCASPRWSGCSVDRESAAPGRGRSQHGFSPAERWSSRTASSLGVVKAWPRREESRLTRPSG